MKQRIGFGIILKLMRFYNFLSGEYLYILYDLKLGFCRLLCLFYISEKFWQPPA